jgi:hypothetical protein
MQSSTNVDNGLPLVDTSSATSSHQHHAAVAVVEIAEIMVGTHLAAINCIFFTHDLLDKRVARFALDGPAAIGCDRFDGIPGQSWVVDDR